MGFFDKFNEGNLENINLSTGSVIKDGKELFSTDGSGRADVEFSRVFDAAKAYKDKIQVMANDRVLDDEVGTFSEEEAPPSGIVDQYDIASTQARERNRVLQTQLDAEAAQHMLEPDLYAPIEEQSSGPFKDEVITAPNVTSGLATAGIPNTKDADPFEGLDPLDLGTSEEDMLNIINNQGSLKDRHEPLKARPEGKELPFQRHRKGPKGSLEQAPEVKKTSIIDDIKSGFKGLADKGSNFVSNLFEEDLPDHLPEITAEDTARYTLDRNNAVDTWEAFIEENPHIRDIIPYKEGETYDEWEDRRRRLGK